MFKVLLQKVIHLPAMNKNIIILILLLSSFKLTEAQVTANIQMNNTSFCGVNSDLVVEDISTGAVVGRTWTINGPGGFTSFTGTNTIETVNLTAIGAYSVNLEVCDAANVCNDITRNFFVNELPTAVITVDDTIVCDGSAVNFSAVSSIYNTPGAVFSWDNDFNTGIDEVAPFFTFLANADIQVMLMVEDDNGCIDSAFQDLTIVTNEEAIFTLEDQCVGVPFELTTTSSTSSPLIDSVYWYVDSTFYLVGETQTYTHTVAEELSVVLFVENNFGCIGRMINRINVEEFPVLTTNITDTVLCEGMDLLLSASGADLYVWSNGETTDSINVSPIQTTNYTVIATSQSGNCKSEEIEIEVEVINKPSITFDSRNFNPTAGTPSQIEVDYEPKFAINDSLFWLAHNTSNELENTTGFENSFVANETANFPVELVYYKSGFRCTTQDSVQFEIDEDCSIENVYIANTFTPNGDDLNDVFLISGFNIAEVTELVVYDRTGKEVFYAENLAMQNGVMQNGWNGNNKNNVRCTNGVYVYSYKLKCLNGADVQSSGNVTLVR